MNEENALALITRQQQEQLAAMTEITVRMAGVMADMDKRLRALEKMTAQKVTVDSKTVKMLMALIRTRADECCTRYRLDAKAHGAAFRRAIKKTVLKTYGIDDLHDLPAAYLALAQELVKGFGGYEVAMKEREAMKIG